MMSMHVYMVVMTSLSGSNPPYIFGCFGQSGMSCTWSYFVKEVKGNGVRT